MRMMTAPLRCSVLLLLLTVTLHAEYMIIGRAAGVAAKMAIEKGGGGAGCGNSGSDNKAESTAVRHGMDA
jgi:hypothetical protein